MCVDALTQPIAALWREAWVCCSLSRLPAHLNCSNTLELPDYADALLALQPELQEEWAALSDGRGGQQLPGGGCPQLVTMCRKVFEEKLKVWHGLLGSSWRPTRAVCSLSHAALSRVPMLLCRVCVAVQLAVTCTSYGLDGS